jgi:hypothetical protein
MEKKEGFYFVKSLFFNTNFIFNPPPRHQNATPPNLGGDLMVFIFF